MFHPFHAFSSTLVYLAKLHALIMFGVRGVRAGRPINHEGTLGHCKGARVEGRAVLRERKCVQDRGRDEKGGENRGRVSGKEKGRKTTINLRKLITEIG